MRRGERWVLLSALMLPFFGVCCGRVAMIELERAIGADPTLDPSNLFCAGIPNGCGPSGFLANLIPNCVLELACFTEACNEHDICYTTCENPRERCDNLFLRSMLAECAEHFDLGDGKMERCVNVTFVYWRIVSRFGEGAYDNMQEWACLCGEVHFVFPLEQARRVVPAFVEAPFNDMDDDLLPDEWETSHGLDPNDPADAALDPDLDELSNLYEFVHGTDPCNPDTDGDGIGDGIQASLAQLGQTTSPAAPEPRP